MSDMDDIQAVEDYAQRLGKFRAKLKHQILGFLEEAKASPNPPYYLNQLGHATFITWQMVSGAKLVGTKQEYAQVADNLVDFWCKPINLEWLIEISTVLQNLREQRMARLLGEVPGEH